MPDRNYWERIRNGRRLCLNWGRRALHDDQPQEQQQQQVAAQQQAAELPGDDPGWANTNKVKNFYYDVMSIPRLHHFYMET